MKRIASAFAAASCLMLVATSSALGSGSSALLVNHGDPFAACAVGGNAFGALNYRSAEVEPWITNNPANTANSVGVWQQDRWSDGGAKGQVAAWTFDGGRTWGQTPQPFTECAQPFYKTRVLQYQRTSDPWASVGPDGTVYTVSLPFDGDFIRNGLATAVSHDGGRTWTTQQDINPLIARPDTLDPTDDKQSVTADPIHAGVAYAVWDQLRDIFPPCPAAAVATHAALKLSNDGHQTARRAAASLATSDSATPCRANGAFLFTGPTVFSRTTDGGRTWETPRVIVPTGVNEQTIGNVILVNHQNGVVYDFFNFIDNTGANNIEMVFSNDHGVTWSAPQYVQRLFSTSETRGCACGVVFPGDPTKPLRTGDIIPSMTIDPNTGQLYVIWQDGRPNNFQNDMLLASTSTAGGLTGTWSAPTLVNPPTDQSAFTAAIAVDGKGRVGVIYYDFTPPITSPDVLLTDTWLTTTNGPGLNFGPRKLIGGPYNMEAAPIARGFFTGDYEGLTTGGKGGRFNGFQPLFVMTNCADTSCRAQGTTDGTPAGPDSTDVFTAG